MAAAAIARPAQHLEQHAVRDLESATPAASGGGGLSFLKVSSLQPTKPSGGLRLHQLFHLLRIAGGLGFQLRVFDDVLRRLATT